jgi:hypothetical protein
MEIQQRDRYSGRKPIGNLGNEKLNKSNKKTKLKGKHQ